MTRHDEIATELLSSGQRRSTWGLFFLLIALLATTAIAQPARVPSLHEGDTITARADGQATRVRLHGIDAPGRSLTGMNPRHTWSGGWTANAFSSSNMSGSRRHQNDWGSFCSDSRNDRRTQV